MAQSLGLVPSQQDLIEFALGGRENGDPTGTDLSGWTVASADLSSATISSANTS